jgi:hypothetical protein
MRSLLLLLLLAGPAFGEVTLTAPSGPVDPKDFVQIMVSGLSDAELPAARVDWTPQDGVTLIPAKTWGGQPFLWFSARNKGTYKITVTVNGWRQSLDTAIRDATAAKIDPALLAKLEAANKDLGTKYPTSTAACAVEVAGSGPNPPIPPVPPVPTPGVRKIILVWETSQSTPALSRLIQDLRNLPYLAERKHSLKILDKDTKSPSGTVPAELAQALRDIGGQTLPAVCIYDDQGRLVGKAACPADKAGFLELIKQNGG